MPEANPTILFIVQALLGLAAISVPVFCGFILWYLSKLDKKVMASEASVNLMKEPLEKKIGELAVELIKFAALKKDFEEVIKTMRVEILKIVDIDKRLHFLERVRDEEIARHKRGGGI